MWDTPSPSEARIAPATAWQRGVDVAFIAWAVVLLYATMEMEGYETVPYHILFVSFAAVYGFRVWSLRVTVFAGPADWQAAVATSNSAIPDVVSRGSRSPPHARR